MLGLTLNDLGSRLDIGVVEPNKISIGNPVNDTGDQLVLKPFTTDLGIELYTWRVPNSIPEITLLGDNPDSVPVETGLITFDFDGATIDPAWAVTGTMLVDGNSNLTGDGYADAVRTDTTIVGDFDVSVLALDHAFTDISDYIQLRLVDPSGDSVQIGIKSTSNTNIFQVFTRYDGTNHYFNAAGVDMGVVDLRITKSGSIFNFYARPTGSTTWQLVEQAAVTTVPSDIEAIHVNSHNYYNASKYYTLGAITIMSSNSAVSYTDPGATAFDIEDGSITGNIVTSYAQLVGGSLVPVAGVDISTVGTYYITYNVSDSEGATAPVKVREVNIT